MQLFTVIKQLNLKEITTLFNDTKISGFYCGDWMSHALYHLTTGTVWLTVTAHANVIAIAKKKGAAAVILCHGENWEQEIVLLAQEQNIPLFASEESTFALSKEIAKIIRE